MNLRENGYPVVDIFSRKTYKNTIKFNTMTTPIGRRLIFSFAICYCFFLGQSPAQFQNTTGAGGIDKANSIISTGDKGLLICGESCNTVQGKSNAFILKLNSSGQAEWIKAYGSLQDKESLNDIKPTTDNGLIAVGERYLSNPKGRGEVGVLLKTDASGNMQSWKEFDHLGNEAEGFCLQVTDDKGFVIAGMMKELQNLSDPFFSMQAELEHLYVLKTDKDATSQWAGYISGAYSSKGQYVHQTSDNGFVVTGYVYKSNAGESAKICLLKLDSQGSMQWIKVYDNEGKKEEIGMTVVQTADNGFMICGTTGDAGQGAEDIFLVKTSPSGEIAWSKTYGGGKIDMVKSMQKVPQGGYIITGTTNSFGSSYDAFLLKVDEIGQVQWFKTYGTNFYEMSTFVTPAEDGFAMTGFNINSGSVDVVCIKTDKNGNNVCSLAYELKSGAFPLKQIAAEPIKWEFKKDAAMVKTINANGSGAQQPLISQQSLCK